jgi:hypothetical protein
MTKRRRTQKPTQPTRARAHGNGHDDRALLETAKVMELARRAAPFTLKNLPPKIQFSIVYFLSYLVDRTGGG